MEKTFDEAAMLHFIRDCLFRFDSPLHHKFSNSVEQLIAERIANREGEWFSCMVHDLRSLQSAFSEAQPKHVELEQRIDAMRISAANATTAAEQRIDALQLSTENATRAAANKLQLLEGEFSKGYILLQEFAQYFSNQQQPSNQQQTPNQQPLFQHFQPPPQHPHPQPPLSHASSNCRRICLPTTSHRSRFHRSNHLYMRLLLIHG